MSEATLFPEWVKAHESDDPLLPARIRAMHNIHGKVEGQTCKKCTHLVRFRAGSYWFKCELTKQTHGASTDWRAGWQACGKYEEGPQDHVTVKS